MPEDQYRFAPRPIGANWLVCFVCGSMKNGYSELDPASGGPAGKVIYSYLYPDEVHYGGGYFSTQPDMASYVGSKETGEAVKQMFAENGAKVFLDYRPDAPKGTQVKVGVCETHLPNLERLRNLVLEADCHITPSIIRTAMELTDG